MDKEPFPVALLMFALAPAVCLALMWPTGDDDMWWGAVMALPFYGLASVHHLITRPYRRQRLMSLGGVVLMAMGVWSVFFAAFEIRGIGALRCSTAASCSVTLLC